MNKTKLIKIFLISSIISLHISCSHQKQQFNVDRSVSLTIDSIFKANTVIERSLKPKFSFHVKKTFDYETFGQDRMDLADFLKESSGKSSTLYVSGNSECYLTKDTINLTAVLGYEARIGLIISIFDDTFNSRLRLIATDKIYSKTESKSHLRNDIILNSDSSSLTLTEKPKFRSGSSLKGKMDVKFESFYQLDSSNRLSRIAPELSIIFDTEIR